VRPKKVKAEIDYVLFIIDDRKVKKTLGESLFHGNFYHPKHRWEYYEAFNSQFPSREVLSTVKGIIFPGAYFSAYQDLPWIHQLKDFIRMVHADFPLIKMVGICFGHQILSLALGGSVCRMQEYLNSISMPLYIGKEQIKLKDPDAFYSLPFVKRALKGIQGPNPFVINCCHGDHVEALP
jgi:GMP synthase-like glutamine amidotransferase